MSKLPRFTADNILSWNPCDGYEKDKLKGWFGRRKYATALMVVDEMRGKIPDEDILWLVLRPECIPEKLLHTLACDFAWKTLPIYEKEYPTDNRPRKAIQTKRRWIKGTATDAELCATIDAARAAAEAAAMAAEAAWAAMAAARDAARDARDAWDAAWDARAAAEAAWAAMAAARDAAWAARDAACVAEEAMLRWQVKRVRVVLRKEVGGE